MWGVWECDGAVYFVRLLVLCCGMRCEVVVGQHRAGLAMVT